jgi:hypothetical protein
MSILDGLYVPVKIQEPIEVTTQPGPRQNNRHLNVQSSNTAVNTVFVVPTGCYWVLKSLIIEYIANSSYGQRTISVFVEQSVPNPTLKFIACIDGPIVNRSQVLTMTLLPGIGSSDTETHKDGPANILYITSLRPVPAVLVENQQIVIIAWNTNVGEVMNIDLDYIEVGVNG